jgi:hypothetical protein
VAPESPSAKPAKQVKQARKGRAAKAARSHDASSIGFPYLDLEIGISVARALHDAGGVPLTRDQLAGAMKLAAGSGNFVLRIGTARQFGLIENKDGKYQLTQLGFSIVDTDEKRERAARAEAFLAVPLYRRVYDEFRGKPLPPRPLGLEQAFVQFGVAPKQKDKARHAFDRSARQAGFFVHGEDRLVEPIIGGAPASPAERRPSDQSPLSRAITAQSRKGYHPFIEGLLLALPEPHEVWPATERAKWLRAAHDIFELIYKSDAENTSEATHDLVTTKPRGPEQARE